MRKIAVFTGSRAEYGLLFWLMKEIQIHKDFELQIIVSGMHLSPQYGNTFREIEADGFKIDIKVDMQLGADTPASIVKSMGVGTIGFADALNKLKPDLLVILGDRYEALAIAQAALIMTIPIAHIHGGELSLGAYDNSIRHAITKMASLHFTATEKYRQRIIQMGEDRNTVFNTGACGLEHIIRSPLHSLEALNQQFQIALRQPYCLITYHPETLGSDPEGCDLKIILQALHEMTDYQLLFTYPNADNGGHAIIQIIETYCKLNPDRAIAVKSLGSFYLSAVAHAKIILGNSSSAIIEVPSLRRPSINIGTRQQGRLAAASVIHCRATYDDITAAINKANSSEFQALCDTVINPYGDGYVSKRILSVISTQDLSVLKTFQDLDFTYE